MNEYTMTDFAEFERMMAHAADMEEREKNRPRETKYDTTAFYNFKHKSRRRIK